VFFNISLTRSYTETMRSDLLARFLLSARTDTQRVGRSSRQVGRTCNIWKESRLCCLLQTLHKGKLLRSATANRC